MNVIQQGIITLLKCAITGQCLPLPEGFDLERAYPVIRRHHMIPLAYEGAVNCGMDRNHPVMKRMFAGCCRATLYSEGQQRQAERIFAAFDAAGIDYMPLKGCEMKPRYPRPELRMMGDADILIRLEQYHRAVPIMEELGFDRGEETDHELPWSAPELKVELHKHLIPTNNTDFYPYFGTGWDRAHPRGGCRYGMTPEDEFIYLLTHFAKHYRDGGIGCRHVVDLWVYRRCTALDEGRIRAELEKLGLLIFYDHTLALLEAWFAGGPMTEMASVMTAYIFSSGSWGVDESRALSQVVNSPRMSGRLGYLLWMAFPSVELLRGKYTVLKKAPWLLPVVWIVRPFYKLLFEAPTLKRRQRSLAAMSRENLRERRQMLRLLGLEL